uniref:Uncharacterized protein n=1 Tax=Spongospora subterranea TaxID=70186 RepID=A0A0H5R425_9EUKA|eukprot:CRZ08602.1 hypothetical protein [Spongospora subterranea]
MIAEIRSGSINKPRDELGKYSNEFRLLAQDVDWTQSTLIHQYRQGLSPDLQRMLILAEGTGLPFNTLDQLVTTTTSFHSKMESLRPTPVRAHQYPQQSSSQEQQQQQRGPRGP